VLQVEHFHPTSGGYLDFGAGGPSLDLSGLGHELGTGNVDARDYHRRHV
jgi:hypothetical protein